MRTILKDDDVIIVGTNAPILLNAGDPEGSAVYRLQSGSIAGKATGRFPVVGGLTYVECSNYYPNYVPDELGGGTNKTVLVYVASAFALGDVPGLQPPTPTPNTPVTPGTGITPTPAKPAVPAVDESAGDEVTLTQPQTSTWSKVLPWGLGAVLLLSIVGLVMIIGRTSKKA